MGGFVIAKRFTDSEKWNKQWIRELPPNMKLFWFYLLDNCDHAGIYNVDIKLANFQIGVRGLTEEKILETFNRKILPFKSGKWFIPKFIEFQYGDLNESNRAHLSVIKILKKYKLYENDEIIRGLKAPSHGAMVKDMVKFKLKEKTKDKKPGKRLLLNKKDQLGGIKENIKEFKDKYPHLNIDFYYDSFIDYLDANDKKYKNYKSAFNICCRSEWYKDRPNSTVTEMKKKINYFLVCPTGHYSRKTDNKSVIGVCPKCHTSMVNKDQHMLDKILNAQKKL